MHRSADSLYDRYRIECNFNAGIFLGFCQTHILKLSAYPALKGKFSFAGEVVQGYIENI